MKKLTNLKKAEKIQIIDESVENIKTGTDCEKESAAKALLALFRPLTLSTSKALSNKFPHSMDEIIPIVESALAELSIDYLTPRTDTQGKGKLKGQGYNFNLYLKNNLYHRSVLILKDDLDGPGRKDKYYNGAANATTQQYSVVLDQELHPMLFDGFNYNEINEFLDYIEARMGSKVRELILLFFIYKFKKNTTRKVLQISKHEFANHLDLIKEEISSFYGLAIV